MSEIKLDVSAFYGRAKRIFESWAAASKSSDFEALKPLTHLLILAGDADEELTNPKKAVQLQTYLLGYEFPSTMLVFSDPDGERKITCITSQSKTKILNQLPKSQSGIKLEILPRPKDAAAALDVVQTYVDGLVAEGKAEIGHFVKDMVAGKLVDDWNKAIKSKADQITFHDMTPAMAATVAPKDAVELRHHTTSSRLCSTVMGEYFKPKMESIIDRDSKVSHEGLASLVEEKLGTDDKPPDMKIWNKSKTLGDIDFAASDWVFTPIIQSGGKYDLKVSAESNGDNLKTGIILASMGIKYKEYCSMIARTFLIGPDKSQEANYTFVLDLQQHLLRVLKAGAIAKDVYAAGLQYVKDKKPALESNYPKSIGYGTGIEFRDSAYMLGPKNTRTIKEGMVFILYLGFGDLPDPKNKGKTYAILLADTVRIGQESAVLLTEGTKRASEVILDEGEDESEEEVKPRKADRPRNGAPKVDGVAVGNKVLRAKTRNQGKDQDDSKAQVMKEHQQELHEKLHNRGLSRFKGGKGTDANDGKATFLKFESYKRNEPLISGTEDRRIRVDESKEHTSVILPINGRAVPFHVNTIKNVSKTEEGDYTVLRINFQTPGQILGKKEDTPFEDPNATFVRSATFRSLDGRHMSKIADQITNLRKTQNKRESEKKERADVVEQERLIEVRGPKPHRLLEVQIRPALDNKKNQPGSLEVQTNGIRYVNPSGGKVDLLFSNMKHIFFQPCDKEMFVILHVHLRSPILLNGKKKAKDIQFVREISDSAFDETGNRKRKARYGDEDEIEQEQEERKRRQMLNREFQSFAAKIASAAGSQNFDFEVDIPFRELGFFGVPFRTSVLLQPTTECLVHLTELPFLIITLSEVEVVHLERVQFGLKHFDMVFIFSDFSRAPVHINSVPMESLDDVKAWLDSVDIATSEGPVNLAWPQIMKTINEDPYQFYKEGGWSFLTGGGDDDEDDDSTDDEDEFKASSVEDESSEDSEDESEFDGDDPSDEESDEAGGSGEESEEGMDWDELEKKAARDDKKRIERGEISDDDAPKKSRGKGGRR